MDRYSHIVRSSCEYENAEHKEPPCIAECHIDCKYILLLYEDGHARFGNEGECASCKFKQLCEELGYPLDCEDITKCEHYDAFCEGLEEHE